MSIKEILLAGLTGLLGGTILVLAIFGSIMLAILI